MTIKPMMIMATLGATLAAAAFALPQPGRAGNSHSAPSARSADSQNAGADENDLRIEGEQRFRTNCGRCHMAPHKFPPRMMATIIRHMRVRATLTDADMRIILRYMTR